MFELIDLRRSYNGKPALDGLTLRVDAGEVVGFLGPNGAGKTTAMRVALGIVRPDSGTLLWQGKPIDLATRLRFGYMPEERGLYSAMKIIDQLIYLGRLHGMTKAAARSASMEWLERLGVGDRSSERLDALSLGNQQRVQLAAALIHEPEVLILDEPFSGLDPTGIEALSKVLQEQAANGRAVVFSSHQLDLVEGLCERVVIVSNGRDVINGTVADLTETTDRLLVEVDAPTNDWAKDLQGVEIMSAGKQLQLRLAAGIEAEHVLLAAQRAGKVRHFSFERKRLSEVFRTAVQA